MSKLNYVKGNLKRSDYLRAVLTDTAPYEVPLIVSNDGLYKNLKKIDLLSQSNREIVDGIFFKNLSQYTIPYRYRVTKDAVTTRRLSLIHPSSQARIAEFYAKYDSLICYYSSISRFSIRFPEKVGSTFFFSTDISDKNKYRNNSVDTAEIDLFVRNPASFFAYGGFDRLYKFFSSDIFTRLEKKFPQMILMDISKCFDSIYSHSVSWAVKNSDHAKINIKSSSFGNDFDKLMQRMNHNETNGICIGPEVSRIFAEIILQKIDADIVTESLSEGIVYGRDFECKRYVDDYIFFSKNTQIENSLRRIIEHCLSKYNLHLNELKIVRYERPFLTPKSHIIQSTKVRLTKMFEGVTELINTNILVPRRIFKPSSFIRSFIASIKNGCYEENVKYDMVANYVIASLAKRVDRLTNDFPEAVQHDTTLGPLYRTILCSFLELMFFFYSVNPTVASSFNLSRAIVVIMRFIRSNLQEDAISVSVQLQSLVNQFTKQSEFLKQSSGRSKIPIEILNVLIASVELGDSNRVSEEWLLENVFDVDKMEYFSIVSCLFYIKGNIAYTGLRGAIEKRILFLLAGCTRVKTNAADCNLALDILSCPFVSIKVRREILRNLRSQLSLPFRTNTGLDIDIDGFVSQPWFVQWESLDIIRMIRKKELSAVY